MTATRHHFIQTKCSKCETVEKPKIPTHLHGENQYGFHIQAITLALLNQGFVSMSRTKELMLGFTGGIIDMSVGYVAKLQKRLAGKLTEFMIALRLMIIAQTLIHWDDTVIMINKKRSCLRVYVSGDFAYYAAHKQKNKEGVDSDGILTSFLR